MGKKLAAMFDEAYKLGGLPARVSLARYTQTTAAVAETVEDSPALVQRFEKALVTIRGEYRDASKPKLPVAPAVAADPNRARQFSQVLAGLAKDQEKFLGDVAVTARQVVEKAAQALEVARASVWLYDAARTALECVDLYEHGPRRHSSGLKLTAKDYPVYFTVLQVARAIDASDAHTDRRTSCFSEPYLKPLGIQSMLDIPIWANDTMAGVLCHEHIGPKRVWQPAEADFGVALAGFVSLAIERRG